MQLTMNGQKWYPRMGHCPQQTYQGLYRPATSFSRYGEQPRWRIFGCIWQIFSVPPFTTTPKDA